MPLLFISPVGIWSFASHLFLISPVTSYLGPTLLNQLRHPVTIGTGQQPDDASCQPCHRADNHRQSDDAERTARRHSGQPSDRQPSDRQPSDTERPNNGSTYSLPQAMAQNGEIPTQSIPCHGSWQRTARTPKSAFSATISCHTMTSRAFYTFPAKGHGRECQNHPNRRSLPRFAATQ